MQPQERFSSEVKLINQAGREFPVKYYVSPEGYKRNGEQLTCSSCGVNAIWRLEIYNHIFEPQGSEYYCAKCVPPLVTSVGD